MNVETSFLLHLLFSFKCELVRLDFMELVFFSGEASYSARKSVVNCVEDWDATNDASERIFL